MKEAQETISVGSLLIPAVLAVIGFFGKSLYDIYLDNRKRSRELIESKLQNFYWPICIRLKKNENVYHYLFKGKKGKDEESMNYKISHYVERNILMKNHEEILDIITHYRYLADLDNEIGTIIDEFIKHVSIYKALLDSDINEYPGVVADAKYPKRIDSYFYEKTLELQTILEKKRI